MASQAAPLNIHLHQTSQILEVEFVESTFQLPAEYLRVFSPSAEVRGHGGGPMQLVSGKKKVRITHIEPIGYYSIKLTFDDGHDTGLYTWDTLYQLGSNHERNWSEYLTRLQQAGASREPEPIKYKKV